jgi:ferric-dicitrate binding protein FerR (iron transport regulator)
VLGTSFQVKNFPETDLEVFVEEGTVELSSVAGGDEGKSLTLTKGERGLIKYPSGDLVRAEMIQPDDLFWANKKLIFEETRLSLVFELLRKHYKSVIEVGNEGINSCMLSATFEDEEIDQILNVIGVSFGLTIEKDQDKFIIKGEGCDNE